jgi:hypothetical protein
VAIVSWIKLSRQVARTLHGVRGAALVDGSETALSLAEKEPLKKGAAGLGIPGVKEGGCHEAISKVVEMINLDLFALCCSVRRTGQALFPCAVRARPELHVFAAQDACGKGVRIGRFSDVGTNFYAKPTACGPLHRNN